MDSCGRTPPVSKLEKLSPNSVRILSNSSISVDNAFLAFLFIFYAMLSVLICM